MLDAIRTALSAAQTVVVGGGISRPEALLSALCEAPASCSGRVIDLAVPGLGESGLEAFGPSALIESAFQLPQYSRAIHRGRFRFTPMHHSERLRYLCSVPEIDVLLLRVGPGSDAGTFTLGPHIDFMPALLAKARCVIAELNVSMPHPVSQAVWSRDRLHHVFTSDIELPELGVVEVSDVAHRIAAAVAAFIDDGDCIQLGIGSIPNAVYEALSDRKDLGLHTGMLTAHARSLLEQGVINGQRKTVDVGQAVTGFLAGDRAFYRWAAGRGDLQFMSVEYTHNVAVMAAIDHFVAINTTLEIDLLGQINSEVMKGRQISGSGGLVDFMRGASASRGGRNIIALNATAAGGSLSRIVPRLTGGMTTALRNDMDIVVTEYGTARLRGLDLDARAEALIGLAAPEHRSSLQQAWATQRSELLGL
jgi:4-hydroxybutyrate CoA-transferase